MFVRNPQATHDVIYLEYNLIKYVLLSEIFTLHFVFDEKFLFIFRLIQSLIHISDTVSWNISQLKK